MNAPFTTLTILAVFLVLHILANPILGPGGVPRCWYPAVTSHPLVFKECNDIILHHVTHDDKFNPDMPLSFSRERSLKPDIKLPKTWHGRNEGDCVVGVDIPEAIGGSEKTSLTDIMYAAQGIAIECVIKPPHLGGILQIGWQNKLNVVIVSMHGDTPRYAVANGTLDDE